MSGTENISEVTAEDVRAELAKRIGDPVELTDTEASVLAGWVNWREAHHRDTLSYVEAGHEVALRQAREQALREAAAEIRAGQKRLYGTLVGIGALDALAVLDRMADKATR